MRDRFATGAGAANNNKIRLVTDDTSEVISYKDAERQAGEQDLDLVLVNDRADPPIYKILDYNKYKYDQSRKQKEAARSQRESRVQIKEVQFKPNIDQHDLETKCRKISKFLSKGNKVKIVMQFRGRERQHAKLGFEILERVMNIVEDAAYDTPPSFTVNKITAIIKGNKDGA